jgi:hypothetical protein
MNAYETIYLRDILKRADPDACYPLLPARRAWFVAQIAEYDGACDPDECDLPTECVSEEQDERNSRPFPY